jgi:hypothetical protein
VLARIGLIPPQLLAGPSPTHAQFDALIRDAGIGTPASLIETSSPILIRGLLLESDRLTLVSAH